MLHSDIGRTCLIAYGSETGNAFDYAEELGRLVERFHFSAFVTKLDGVDIVNFLTLFNLFMADISTVYLSSILRGHLCCIYYWSGGSTTQCKVVLEIPSSKKTST